MTEDAWNTRDPVRVVLACTPDTQWRNRAEFLRGRDQVAVFLVRKWRRELEYRLIKQLWAFSGNRIAVRFACEYRDDRRNWFRTYGNENWEFDDDGLMRTRLAIINEHPIPNYERALDWPLGRRPDDFAALDELGF